ncbi:Hypothetical protein A7982_06741 [Minicystis rosea]|nr:Hypothetical protein A7982_06741 [Minicystis rosea]
MRIAVIFLVVGPAVMLGPQAAPNPEPDKPAPIDRDPARLVSLPQYCA